MPLCAASARNFQIDWPLAPLQLQNVTFDDDVHIAIADGAIFAGPVIYGTKYWLGFLRFCLSYFLTSFALLW